MAAPAKQHTAPPTQTAYDTMRDLLTKNVGIIQQACAKTVTGEKLARMMLTEMIRNPKLAECSKASVLGFLLRCAQLGLEVGPLDHVYPIPFNNKKAGGRLEVQLIVGYKGLVKLCWNSGLISTFSAQDVRENDQFKYQLGTDSSILHVPILENRSAKVKWYYATAKLKDGGYQFEVMTYDELMKHKNKFSKAKDAGPWVDNEPEMCKKTVLRRLCKLLPMSTELATAVGLDEKADADIPQHLGSMVEIPEAIREIPSHEEEMERAELDDIQQGLKKQQAEQGKAPANGHEEPQQPAQDEFATAATDQEASLPAAIPDDRWRRCVEYLDADQARKAIKQQAKVRFNWETMMLGKVDPDRRRPFLLTVMDLAKASGVPVAWPE